MRTDRDADRPADAETAVTRRRFVAAAGVTAGVGLSGVAGAADASPGLVVETTAPYESAVDRVVSAFREREDGVAVALRTSDGPSALDEEADVRVSGRPDPGAGLGDDATTAVAAHGWGALARPDGEWRETLAASPFESDGDAPVEIWSETDWDTVDALADAGDEDGEKAVETGPTRPLVRGTRWYQYSEGKGGVGYYPVGDDEVRRLADDGEDSVPLVRLGYVHAGDTDDPRVEQFRSFYAEEVTPADASVSAFADPGVLGDADAALWL